tara:strand:+ start:173 stop:505 length:333 start_codon:yes stop_codon:yes gene_type:complete
VRYTKNRIFQNRNASYKRYLKPRGMKEIMQYSTSKFRHPGLQDLQNFDRVSYIWKTGDKYYKLADEYYHDSTKWWVIALYNQKPTEAHVKAGEVVYIPTPLDSVLYYMGY